MWYDNTEIKMNAPHYGLAVASPSLLQGNEKKAQSLVLLQSAFEKNSHPSYMQCFIMDLVLPSTTNLPFRFFISDFLFFF